MKIVNEFDYIKFVHSFDEKIKNSLNASTITLFKSFDEKINKMQESFNL